MAPLLPLAWRNLQAQATGDVLELPRTGAHVTLADLLRESKRHAEESGLGEDDGDLEELTQPPSGPISGWIGTPDPRKYAPGTTYLGPSELQAEIEAGNVVALEDWGKALDDLEPWERHMLSQALAADFAKYRVKFEIEGSDGKPAGHISLWDLHQYVYNNPKLKALVDSQKSIQEAGAQQQEEGSQLPGHMVPYVEAPGDPYGMALPQEVVKQLAWVRAARGQIWKRRPSQWLRGMDGQLDFNFAVYLHEGQAEKVLGPKYAGRDPRKILPSEEYWRDVLAAGPQLGMTFMLAAARDIPIQDAASSLGTKLVQRMGVRGSSKEGAQAHALALADCLDPRLLAAETKLLTPTGTHIRKGSTLMLTTFPGDKLIMQGMTGDPISSREYYSLGALYEVPELCAALGSLFLGGGPGKASEPPLDEEAVPVAGTSILLAANGYKAGEGIGPESHIRYPRPAVTLRPNVPARFQLRGGQSSSSSASTSGRSEGTSIPSLLRGIREQVLASELHSIFSRAAAAADAAMQGLPADAVPEQRYAARRRAAEEALQSGFAALGVDSKAMGISLQRSPADLASSAQPLVAGR